MTRHADSADVITRSPENTQVAHEPAGTDGHIRALDGIRGLGVILVLFYHYGSSAAAHGLDNLLIQMTGIGWSGVDMFFVLSGFLITGILYDSKGKSNFFRNFYARRTLRIFPLYYFAAIAVIALAVVTGEDLLGGANPLWILFYVGNFQMAFEGGGSLLDHFWSLAIEEQFYLVWPFFVLSLSRKKLMLLATALIVSAPLIRTLLVMNDAPALATYVLTPARTDGLATGALIALAIRGSGGVGPLVPWAWRIGAIALVGLALVIWFGRDLSSEGPLMLTVGISLLTAIFASVLILSLTFRPLTNVMELPVMRWFGKYSYGLYVWHPIVNMILLHSSFTGRFGELTPEKVVMLLAVAFALSVLTALVSYKFLEAPLLRLKRHFH